MLPGSWYVSSSKSAYIAPSWSIEGRILALIGPGDETQQYSSTGTWPGLYRKIYRLGRHNCQQSSTGFQSSTIIATSCVLLPSREGAPEIGRFGELFPARAMLSAYTKGVPGLRR